MDHPHPPSAGKDLTGGPGPWAPGPGFLCPQQRPENSPGHARTSVLSALSLREELPEDSQGLTLRSPQPAAGEGALEPGRPSTVFPLNSLWVWGKTAKSPEARATHFFTLFSLLPFVAGPWGALRSQTPQRAIVLILRFQNHHPIAPTLSDLPEFRSAQIHPLPWSLRFAWAHSRCPPSAFPCPRLTRRGAEMRLACVLAGHSAPPS